MYLLLSSPYDKVLHNQYKFNCSSYPISLVNDNGINSVHISDRRYHDDIIKWKHFPCYWPFVRGIHRSPVNSPHKGQWCGALMFSFICAWINGWDNRKAGDLRCHHTHYDITVILPWRWYHSFVLSHRFSLVTGHGIVYLQYWSDIWCWSCMNILLIFMSVLSLNGVDGHILWTHWGRDKMADIFQTTFSNAFCWMKMYEFRLKFHWSLFLRVKLTIFQLWYRKWLGANQQNHYLNHWWLNYRRLYASLGLNYLTCRPLHSCFLSKCNSSFNFVHYKYDTCMTLTQYRGYLAKDCGNWWPRALAPEHQ